jgi:hypothetical protein
MPLEERTLTYGEKAVGLTFNPSNDPMVQEVKELYAKIIDILKNEQNHEGYGERSRHFAVAITDAETAQMRAVKAVTFTKTPMSGMQAGL